MIDGRNNASHCVVDSPVLPLYRQKNHLYRCVRQGTRCTDEAVEEADLIFVDRCHAWTVAVEDFPRSRALNQASVELHIANPGFAHVVYHDIAAITVRCVPVHRLTYEHTVFGCARKRLVEQALPVTGILRRDAPEIAVNRTDRPMTGRIDAVMGSNHRLHRTHVLLTLSLLDFYVGICQIHCQQIHLMLGASNGHIKTSVQRARTYFITSHRIHRANSSIDINRAALRIGGQTTQTQAYKPQSLFHNGQNN